MVGSSEIVVPRPAQLQKIERGVATFLARFWLALDHPVSKRSTGATRSSSDTYFRLPVSSFGSGLGEVEDALDLIHKFTMVDAYDAKRLKLERNPWIMPPEAVVEEGPMAVGAYLMDVRAAKAAGAEAKTLRLLKLVLVGSSQAGKTRYPPARFTGYTITHFYKECSVFRTHNNVDDQSF